MASASKAAPASPGWTMADGESHPDTTVLLGPGLHPTRDGCQQRRQGLESTLVERTGARNESAGMMAHGHRDVTGVRDRSNDRSLRACELVRCQQCDMDRLAKRCGDAVRDVRGQIGRDELDSEAPSTDGL
jgi:hypothetical protein